ncbi:MAG: cyclic nucleotide-binding domain-containing protein [Nitrospinae bacterium]|nr:cyclic nucleotide-binding domain-containing protein [Nitrospinota bacterium]
MGKRILFGQYLINKGAASQEKVHEALIEQKKHIPHLEDLLVTEGFLTKDDVFMILSEQEGTEEGFLDVAMANNHLTHEQVEAINKKVLSLRPQIGSILVKNAVITEEVLQQELEEFEQFIHEYDDIRAILKKVKVFDSLTPPVIDYLAYIPERIKAPSNQIIIKQGEESDSFYAVAKGALKVTTDNPAGGEGIYITTIGPKDIFGEAAIFGNVKRNANIIAQGEVELLQFEKSEFLEFLRKFPMSSQSILLCISRRLLFKLSSANKKEAYGQQKSADQDSGIDGFFDMQSC